MLKFSLKPGSCLANHQRYLIAMQPLPNDFRGAFRRMFQGAFPDDGHTPAKLAKHFRMARIATDVSLKFLLPEISIDLGSRCVSAALMPVPETAMNEYHGSVLRKHKVRASGKAPYMKSIAESFGKQTGAKSSLWPSVLRANTRHHKTALWGGWDTHGL